MAQVNFDATNVPQRTSFDPIKPGWYAMRIIGADMVPSEKAGEMLKLQHEIDENVHPELSGRQVFSNLCINHPESKQARDIARSTLSAICHSIGKLQIGDTEELLGAEIRVRLKVKPAEGNYEAKNEVQGYKPLSEPVDAPAGAPKVSAAGSAPAAATATAAPAGAKTKPWGK